MPKAVKKTVKKAVKKVGAPTPKFDYTVVIAINDETFKIKTNDIAEAIQSVKPEFLRTKTVVKVTKGKKTLDRLLYLQQGKMLFNNRITLESFVKNLIF